MGAAAACELSQDGARVTLIDQSPLPNPRAASVDHSKVFRFAYPDPLYVKLAADALVRWRSLESATSTRLMTPAGALLIGQRRPSFETQCHETMAALGLDSELLDSSAVRSRFPQFNTQAFAYGVYDPAGAILHAETAVRALIGLAKQRGVEIVEGARIVSIKKSERSRLSIVDDTGKEFSCERVVVASGPWTRNLLPFMEDKLTTTRQETVYFQPRSRTAPSFEPPGFPIFLELESGFYGLPIHHAGAIKIANHHRGTPVDARITDEHVDGTLVERCRAFFAEFIPELVDATVVETRVCIYNNTPDDDFIVDWHPSLEGVLMVTGFSGHGFKFGPTIGRIAADLLGSGRTSYDIHRFRLGRFDQQSGI
jgi:monomeric sarcosine oxidase